jgi:hypothetical protein
MVEKELTDAQRAILRILAADIPESVRMLNVAALCEEDFCGRDAYDEENLPGEYEYEQFVLASESLAERGLLSTVDVFGVKTYVLTDLGLLRALAEHKALATPNSVVSQHDNLTRQYA